MASGARLTRKQESSEKMRENKFVSDVWSEVFSFRTDPTLLDCAQWRVKRVLFSNFYPFLSSAVLVVMHFCCCLLSLFKPLLCWRCWDFFFFLFSCCCRFSETCILCSESIVELILIHHYIQQTKQNENCDTYSSHEIVVSLFHRHALSASSCESLCEWQNNEFTCWCF